MSLRTYNKDHIKEHAGVSLTVQPHLDNPKSGDSLVFWTKNNKHPCKVDLRPYSTGQTKSNSPTKGGKNFVPFSGRPELIRQLTPAIEEFLAYAPKATVAGAMNTLRDWWRILDSVESAAAEAGQLMTRVEDVRLLTQVHCEWAHRSGMPRQSFGRFRSIVNVTRLALGLTKIFWESPEDTDLQKHIPSQEQRNALRFAIRDACRSVLDKWELSDSLSQIDTEPAEPTQSELWRNVKYMRSIQKATGKTLPTADDLDNIPTWALNTIRTLRLDVRESIFPNNWDAHAVWHLCALNTGWNPSTLTTLDVTKSFLLSHFKDDPNDPHRRFVLSAETYELVGEKERAGGKSQFVTGQWKTQDGPGHLIKTYLERVEPLREVLKQQLAQEQLKYKQMDDANYEARMAQFEKITKIQQGVCSVWLYVNHFGKISWMQGNNDLVGMLNNKQVTFLEKITYSLNAKRAKVNAQRKENSSDFLKLLEPIPRVTAKDFRVWFADYVYRASNGNLLQVKKALNHSLMRTTSSYTNTNILNQDTNNIARSFLNILVSELDVGRIDLTIIAHLHRHGKMTTEQEELLAQARTLPKSRLKIGCKDTRRPPPHIKATVNNDCDVQRCLLCLENAVLLPESLDGIAMRIEELLALQASLPIETWIEDMFDIELKNNQKALDKFDFQQGQAARKKWNALIVAGKHLVPGLPIASAADFMEFK